MDIVRAMTVSPTLPAKKQARDESQTSRQSVSMRTIPLSSSSPSSPSSITSVPCHSSSNHCSLSPLPAENTRATVFVHSNDSIADCIATCDCRIPEVQSSNNHEGRQESLRQLNQNRQQQRPANVVKIKIKSNGNSSKVISTVRLNLDPDTGQNDVEDVINRLDGKQPIDATVNMTNSSVGDQSACPANDSSLSINSLEVGSVFDQRQQEQNKLKEEVFQRKNQDSFNAFTNTGNNKSYFYYGSFPSNLASMISHSGQCSPSDTMDSGTCSDLDGTPPPLPKKKGSSTVVLGNSQHNRTGSLTSSGAEVDSDDNESNVSCDSLNLEVSGRLRSINNSINSDVRQQKITIEYRDNNQNNYIDQDQINESVSKFETIHLRRNEINVDDFKVQSNESNNSRVNKQSSFVSRSTLEVNSSKITSSLTRNSRNAQTEQCFSSFSPVVKECTYEERKQQQAKNQRECIVADLYANGNRTGDDKYTCEDDKFYKFHLNECQDKQDSVKPNETMKGETNDDDTCLANFNILETDAIRSAKGTVRGVKNRVRANIATFLQKPSTKDYRAKDAGKVVVYTTTMGIVRETYYACMKVKQILRTHLVKYEERDMYMSVESQAELKDRIGCKTVDVPQLFIDGLYIGNADTVERLNESGELRLMLKPYQSADVCNTCSACGGYRLFPCPVCNGSKKSVHRNDFTAEFVALKCMNCDEVGLVRCNNC